MTFLQPVWFLLLALVPVVVALHFRRRRHLPVSSVYLWERAGVSHPGDHGRRRPRPSPLLIVQVLVVVLLTLALARPIWNPGNAVDHEVFIVDTSASMLAADSGNEGSDTRLRSARKRIEELLAAGIDASVRTIIVADSAPDVLAARVSVDKARDAVATEITRTHETAAWGEVAAMLHHVTDPDEKTTVTVLTDPWGRAEVERAMADEVAGSAFRVTTFGSRLENAGFRGVNLSSSSTDGASWVLEGAVTWTGEDDWRGTVRVLHGLERREVAETSLRATRDRPGAFRIRLDEELEPGVLELRLPDDDLAHDNAAFVQLRRNQDQVRVLRVGDANARLDRALSSVVGVVLDTTERLPEDATEYDLVVIDGARVDEAVPTHAVWLDAAPPGSSLAGSASAPGPTAWNGNHVLARGVDWGELEVSEADLIDRIEGASVLVQHEAGPLIQARHTERRLEVVAAFSPDDSNWLDLTSFPRFAANIVRWIEPMVGHEWAVACQTGASCALPNRDRSMPRVVPPDPPDGAVEGSYEVEVGAGGFESFFRPRVKGRYQVGGDGFARTRAVDALHLAESAPHLGSPEATESGGASPPVTGRQDPRQLADGGQARDLWPWVVIAAAFLVLVEAFLLWRRRARGRTVRARAWRPPFVFWLARLAQVALLAALVLAFLEVPLPLPEPPPRHVFVLENEDVIGEAARDPIRALERTASREGGREGDAIAIHLGETPVREENQPRASSGPRGAGSGENGTRRGDVGVALRVAEGLLTGDARSHLVLGVRESGFGADERGTLKRIASKGHGFTTVPLGGVPAGDVIVESVGVPERVDVGVPFDVEAIVYSEAQADVMLRVLRDGEPAEEAELSLKKGHNRVRFAMQEDSPGSALYEVVVGGASGGVGWNDANGAVVEVRDGPNVAVLSPDIDLGETIANVLIVQGFSPDVLSLSEAPSDFAEWLAYDALVLANVPAIGLSTEQQAQMKSWVRDFGGGLLILGGGNAFGPGGYHQTPIEDLSPLSSEIPRERPQMALVFVLDRSGSMEQAVGPVSRLDIAREATFEAMELLSPDSLVSIVAFDSSSSVVVPLQPVGDGRAVRETLNRLVTGGGTNLQPALMDGLAELRGVEVSPRHIIALTDGLTQAGDFEAILEGLRNEDVSLSAVAIGAGAAHQRLANLADEGGGTLHATADFRALPSILVQEVLMLISDPVREETFEPHWVEPRPRFLGGLPSELPQLHGYVRTTAKEEARVHLTMGEGAPLLASWRYGTGRVAAFASDGAGRWSRDWRSASWFPLAWSQVLRWAQRSAQSPGLDLRLDVRGNELVMEVEALSGSGAPRSDLALASVVRTPDGETRELEMSLVDEGTYATRMRVDVGGVHNVRVEERARAFRERSREPVEGSVYAAYSDRYAFSRHDPQKLLHMSETLGGSIELEADEVLPDHQLAFGQERSRVPWLLLAVTAFMVALVSRWVHATRL